MQLVRELTTRNLIITAECAENAKAFIYSSASFATAAAHAAYAVYPISLFVRFVRFVRFVVKNIALRGVTAGRRTDET
jgi:hypothetical protein